jgi:hypothetical protein
MKVLHAFKLPGHGWRANMMSSLTSEQFDNNLNIGEIKCISLGFIRLKGFVGRSWNLAKQSHLEKDFSRGENSFAENSNTPSGYEEYEEGSSYRRAELFFCECLSSIEI